MGNTLSTRTVQGSNRRVQSTLVAARHRWEFVCVVVKAQAKRSRPENAGGFAEPAALRAEPQS